MKFMDNINSKKIRWRKTGCNIYFWVMVYLSNQIIYVWIWSQVYTSYKSKYESNGSTDYAKQMTVIAITFVNTTLQYHICVLCVGGEHHGSSTI